MFLLGLAGPESGEAAVQTRVEPQPTWSANLSLLQEYRYRTAQAGSASTAGLLEVPVAAKPVPDQDVRLTLDGQARGYGDRLQGQVSAAFWMDVDGHVPKGQPDLFGEISDYRQPLVMVYSLSAELRRPLPLEYLRLGRQSSEHGLPLTFDGAALSLRLWERRLALFGYGGRSVHFFEVQPGLLENWVACAGAEYWPTQDVRVEFDSRFEHDTVLLQDGRQTVWIYAHSYGVNLSTRFEQGWAKLFARGLNRSASHAGGALRLAFPSIRFGIDAQASAQLRSLGEISENENPFYAMLGTSLPNLRSRLELWKEIGLGQTTILALRAGWRVRQVLRGEPGPFNRNAGGVYFQTELNDLAVKGIFVSGSAEWNYLPWSFTNDSFLAVGGSAGYATRKIKVEAGTYYQRWKINYYRDVQELHNARTVLGMVGVRALPWLEVRARYTLDIVDRYIHSAFLSIREDL
jgi:hypothetical protein